MKKIIPLLFIILCFSNCNKDNETNKKIEQVSIEEKKNNKLSKIEKEVISKLDKENIKRKQFKSEVLPLLISLKQAKPTRYKMSYIIGLKLSKEVNQEVFKLGIENLKKEINKRN